MCGIIGFLDKRDTPRQPLGQTLLGMLQALSCRGPDSAGVALFGPPQPFWILNAKLPEQAKPAAIIPAVLNSLQDQAVVLRHQTAGAYLRLEIERSAEPAELEKFLVARFPEMEAVSLG